MTLSYMTERNIPYRNNRMVLLKAAHKTMHHEDVTIFRNN